ncbi:MAG: hypothetical protein ACJAYA_001031 [Bacteroidia bacterium]|jgi:hypothetical protein
MKKVTLLMAMVVGSFAYVSAQVAGPQIEFERIEHDYGTIDQGGNGKTEFVFTNTGTEPLIISKAKGSCGCTVPTWPKEPIAPGASASVEVKYDTKRVGPISKSVTITSNSVDQSTALLKIKGTVQAVATESDSPEMKTIEGATPVSE